MDKKPSEFPLGLPDLNSTHTVHETGQWNRGGRLPEGREKEKGSLEPLSGVGGVRR